MVNHLSGSQLRTIVRRGTCQSLVSHVIDVFFFRYWRMGIVLPPAPAPLKHPRAPFQGVLNILRRHQPAHPGERKK